MSQVPQQSNPQDLGKPQSNFGQPLQPQQGVPQTFIGQQPQGFNGLPYQTPVMGNQFPGQVPIVQQGPPIQQSGFQGVIPGQAYQQTYQQGMTQVGGQSRTEIIGSYQGETIKGESRIEYVPYQREVTEYVTQEVVEMVPKERKVTDYYAVEYATEYVPQVRQEIYIEYVPVENVRERVEYQAIEKQTVIQQPTFQENVNVTTQQFMQPQTQTYVGPATQQVQYSSGSYQTPWMQGSPQTYQTNFAQEGPIYTAGTQFSQGPPMIGGTTFQGARPMLGGGQVYGGAPQVLGGSTFNQQPQFMGGAPVGGAPMMGGAPFGGAPMMGGQPFTGQVSGAPLQSGVPGQQGGVRQSANPGSIFPSAQQPRASNLK